MKISIKKISELTGFSPATVSNALNHKRGVNRDTAEQILNVARQNGYFSEPKIDAIRFVIYKDSGEIVADTPFFSELIEGVEREARASGREVLITNLSRTAPDYQELCDRILSDPGCALLVLATEMDEETAAHFCTAAGPVVMLDNCFDDSIFNTVMIGNTDAVFAAVEGLIASGHQKIGYLKSSVRIRNFFYRQVGYERALALHRLPIDPAYTVSLSPSAEGAYADMCRFLEQKPTLPTAFFADNDLIALGAMRALSQYGCRIPEDLSIIGFDDLPACALTQPPLSTIRVFKREMGQAAVRRLSELIQYGDTFQTKTQICCEFVERNSVKR